MVVRQGGCNSQPRRAICSRLQPSIRSRAQCVPSQKGPCRASSSSTSRRLADVASRGPCKPLLRLRRVGWATSVASWRATCLGIGSGGGCVQSPLHPNKRLSCLLVRVLEPAMDNTDYTSDERHGRTLSLISPSEAARGIDWSNWEPLLSAFAEGQKRQNWPPVHKNSAIGTPAAYAYKREALFWTIQRDSGKERTLWLLGSSRSCLLSPKSAVV